MAGVLGVVIFLLLLFFFPRWFLPISIVAAIALGAFIYWDQMNSDKLAEKRALITAAIEYDLGECSVDAPIMITISNQSDDTVTLIHFSVLGYRPGYSKPVYSSSYNDYQTDRIIEAGQSWSYCWAVPRLAYGVAKNFAELYPPATMTWRVSDLRPTFIRP